MKQSVIMLLGVGGVERTEEHARETARLITEMDPEYLSTLTLTVIPGTPHQHMMDKGKFELPSVSGLLKEMRTMVAESHPAHDGRRVPPDESSLPHQPCVQLPAH